MINSEKMLSFLKWMCYNMHKDVVGKGKKL